MKQSIILAVQIILWTAFLSFDASAQLGFQNPFFVAAELKSAAGGCATPNAPSNCNVDDANDPPQHTVTWNDPSGSFDGIEVWAAIDGGSSAIRTGGIAPGSQSPGFGQWEDLGAAVGDGHVYIYKVRATNACGTQSAFSNTVTNDIFVDATHYWTLNETSGNNRADSIASITLVETASIMTTAVASGTGIRGNAASFDPLTGSYLLANSSVSFSTANSMMLWIKITTAPIATSYYLTKVDDGGDGTTLWSSWNNSSQVVGEDQTGNSVILTPPSVNAWHMLILVYQDGGNILGSIDGANFTVGDVNGGLGDGPLTLGDPSSGSVPKGLLDECCIWPRALSQAEVNSLYGGGTSPRFK